MSVELLVPAAVEAVIQEFDQAGSAVDERAIGRSLGEAFESAVQPTDAARLGAWAEVFAFSVEGNDQPSPWKTYFGSILLREAETSSAFSAVAGRGGYVIDHWKSRAREVKHPVLRARYADLVWDLSRVIAQMNPDPTMARIAVDAYLESSNPKLRVDEHARFHVSVRALNLAVMIGDDIRTDSAREMLLRLHRQAMATKGGLWWIAIDRLLDDRRARVTEEERSELVADLERLASRYANRADAAEFDPYATQAAVKRLTRYYRTTGRGEDLTRVNELVGSAFEHVASLADPMVSADALQIAINAYRDAGLRNEVRRVRVAMEEKLKQAHAYMGEITTEITVSKADLETFLQGVITSKFPDTFARIADAFVMPRVELEKRAQSSAQKTPLMAALSQSIVAENRIAATVGSLEDDPLGRLVREAAQAAMDSDIWLFNALNRAIEVHAATPMHFAVWAARAGLYEDLTLLVEGVAAWFAQDYFKAVHILVPQVEHGLRGIVSKLGLPVTKPHQKIKGASVAINMGDILNSSDIAEKLGRDLVLYFTALYTDPRGLNLRNNIAHGLMDAESIDYTVAMRVIHTLLVLGVWQEIAEARR